MDGGCARTSTSSVADLADRYLDRVQRYLDLYDGWIGAYPYSGFAVVSGPFPVGLGFPGLTYMGAQVLRLPFIPDTSLGHEVLHSWWGNGVRTGTGGNWAEGLTTFMADYTFLERRGADAAREERLAWLRENSILPAGRRPAAHRLHRTDARGVAGDRLPQGGLRLHHAARPDRRGRVRVRGAPVLAGAPLRRPRSGAIWSARSRAHPASRSRGFFAQWVRPCRRPRAQPSRARASTPTRVSFTLAQTRPAVCAGGSPVTVETARRAEPAHGPARRASASAYALDVAGAPRTPGDRSRSARLPPPRARRDPADPSRGGIRSRRERHRRDARRRRPVGAARDVATAFFERPPGDRRRRRIGAAGSRHSCSSGTTREVTDAARRRRPRRAAGRWPEGTARAWAARRPHGPALAVVAADGADALRAVVRPLPHYGSQSFVVFDGARAVDRGLWPPPASPLRIDLGAKP